MLYDFGDGNGLVEARLHSNGGGAIASTARVDDSVFVDRTSVVFGYARIKDRVRVVGHCRVSGENLPGDVSTLIEDDVLISGNVVIEGYVLMRDHSQARNSAKISGSAALMHHSQVADRACIAGQVQLCDFSFVYENATLIGEEDLITLNVRDIIAGDSILSSMKDINVNLGKGPRKRRNQRIKNSEECIDQITTSMVFRKMSAMPTLMDLASISMNQPEERIAAFG